MKRVFLSFRAEDRAQVNGLRLMAANSRFEIEFYDESVRIEIKSTDQTYVRQKIREKINRTSKTICLLSQQTYTSTWVSWEIEESIRKGNGILGMGLPGVSGNLMLPAPMKRLGMPWYLWDLNFLTNWVGS